MGKEILENVKRVMEKNSIFIEMAIIAVLVAIAFTHYIHPALQRIHPMFDYSYSGVYGLYTNETQIASAILLCIIYYLYFAHIRPALSEYIDF
ncbi:hypothetical protein [Natrinema halophilum]|uniref:hypothetical protein n=1 Tax=Natrinema halophilum TaxID=1699371 RepID=UPI001F36D455|nr:hypothetical protein [Natrinema halophilum]UHQ95990.1 hypothetical protein HYG82_21170 [Natrinema halophilum]